TEHRQDAGTARGSRRIDRLDEGVGPVRAPEGRVDLIFQIPVVGIAALAGDQPLILAPALVRGLCVGHSVSRRLRGRLGNINRKNAAAASGGLPSFRGGERLVGLMN